MSDYETTDAVVSGMRYAVTTVDGESPDLSTLVDAGVVALALEDSSGMVYVVHGRARRESNAVLFLEKNQAGVGRDVRTWEIDDHDGLVDAVVRSNY